MAGTKTLQLTRAGSGPHNKRNASLPADRRLAAIPPGPPGRDHRSSDGERLTRQARNLLLNLEGHADGFTFVIRDRDARFAAASGAALTAAGVRILKTPVPAPRRTRSRNARSPAPG
jgi:hypothetical protein